MITSRQHPLVKAFRAAARGDRTRALLDGWHLLRDAAEAGVSIERVAVAGSPDPQGAALLQRLARTADVTEVSTTVMEALSPVRTPSGVAALVVRRTVDLERAFAPAPALVIAAIDVQDPGNAGSIVRSAEAAGATGVILAGTSADPWGWKALRAAMGSTFRLPVIHSHEVLGTCERLRGEGLSLLAAVPRNGVPMYEAMLNGPVALLFGGEGPGLPDAVLRIADQRVTIPMRPPVESLNVAMSAALLAYEGFRQRSSDRL